MLSHEDIRQDVILDVEASDSAVRSVIQRARKEMQAYRDCYFEIKSVAKKGYRLEIKNVSNHVKNKKLPQKSEKNMTQFDTTDVIE
jgi:DNA-binding winged helix-turn-helix (wHTH) protein